ncbi:hypothetical protein BMT54_11715 [Pasteurellaceae bacterium 15-036681]|nr:hypothetical protein BMT54_11715 [Pasteurellaceae bacterium 15-036681]
MNLAKLRMPYLKINLREWQNNDFCKIKESTEKLAHLAGKAGQSSDIFKNTCDRLLITARNKNSLTSEINSALDIRAFTFLLANSEEFIKLIVIDKRLLNRLLKIRTPISKLSLTQLISGFFKFYNKISVTNSQLLCSFIKEQLYLQTQSSRNQLNALVRYSENAELLFDKVGHLKLVEYAKLKHKDLDYVINDFGLQGFKNGLFLTLSQNAYYIETLKTIPVGSAKNPIIKEIKKESVYESQYDEKYLLGHKIIEILIDRSKNEQGEISQDWQDIILSIAGDPRVVGFQYQRWWRLLGEHRIQLMRNWLSRYDLKLFLTILEQSAKENNNYDMERMFAPRKAFMEGLLENKMIIGSRLFLTTEAAIYLYRHYQQEQLPAFARISGHASVIYLELNCGLHIVEGTHSFKIKIMNKLPESAEINHYEKRNYDANILGSGLETLYYREYKDQGFTAETHDNYFNWQNRILKILKYNGSKLDYSKMFTSTDYKNYKNKFGLEY